MLKRKMKMKMRLFGIPGMIDLYSMINFKTYVLHHLEAMSLQAVRQVFLQPPLPQ